MPQDEMPPPTLYGLQTLQGKDMTSPDSRVADAGSLRTIARRMLLDDEPRARERALTKGLLDGNPPYNPKKRLAAGQSWQANLNFLEGEAAIDSARVPYYQIFSGVKEYAVCKTNLGNDAGERDTLSQKISKHFQNLLRGWKEFDWHMQNCIAEMLRWGFSPLVFDVGGSWRMKSIDSKCIKVPMNSASVVDDRLPCIMIIESFTVSELWDKIQDEKAAEDAGWNVRAVKRAIQRAASGVGNTMTPWSMTPWEEWQRRIKNNDLYWSSNGQDVYCYRLLVKEFRHSKTNISQFIVSQSPIYDDTKYSGFTPETEADDAGFLFKHVDRYDCYDDAIIVFFQNTGDGTWHSVRGMAMKGFKHWDASNRLKCKALDSAFQRCAIVLTTDTVKSADDMQLMVFSDRTILPPGTKVAQTGFSGDTEGVMAVDRMLGNHLANNLGVYNQRTLTREDGRGEQPTATAVQNQVMKEASLSQGQISITYTSLDQLYSTIFSKVVTSSDADAVEFRKACEEDGVPIEALKDMESVLANRQSGYGSSAMRQQNLQQLQPFVWSLPESGKNAFNDMMIAATVGVDKIDLLNPKVEIPQEDESIAAAENGAMRAGATQIVSNGQDNVNHIQIHFGDLRQMVDPLRQQMEQGGDIDPASLQSAFAYLQLMGPHIEQHLAPLMRDPQRKQIAKQFQDQLNEYVAFNGKLRSAIRDAQRKAQIQMEDNQNATALGALDQAKIESAHLSDQIKMDKWNTDKSIKLNKAATETRLSAFKTQHATTLDDYSTAADVQRKNYEARQTENA